jgi:hypothetical protein
MNGTRLDLAKLRTVASTAVFVASEPTGKWDSTLASQMLGEGIRKLHDCATSFRGCGKYLGHAHWSRNALRLLHQNGGTERGITKLLSHEHVVPVGVVLSILLRNGTRASVTEIEKLIHRFSVVAIITRDEETLLTAAGLKNKMPEGWNGRDVWARYKAVGLYECIESVPA